ncbi:MAG: transposase [Gemmatimonadota bacterium]
MNQGGARLSYLVHDLVDTKSRVILRRKASLATGSAERATALITELMDRGIEPHVALLAGEAPEDVPKWKRRTFNLERGRARVRKVKEAQARNRVREIHRTRGYTVSRKLRDRSQHVFAEAKNEHGLRRARRRGRERADEQATLSAVVQNLKRLVAFRGRTDGGAAAASSGARSLTGFRPPMAHSRRFLGHIRTTVAYFAFRIRGLRYPQLRILQPVATPTPS